MSFLGDFSQGCVSVPGLRSRPRDVSQPRDVSRPRDISRLQAGLDPVLEVELEAVVVLEANHFGTDKKEIAGRLLSEWEKKRKIILFLLVVFLS